MSTLLVATDFGPSADAAVRTADAWASERGDELVVLHCAPVCRDAIAQQEVIREASDAVQASVAELTGRGVRDFRMVIEAGRPHVEIVRLAESIGASMIFVGARGSAGIARALVGHTAEKIARYAHCDVMMVRPLRRSGKILVATDLSNSADAAVRAAAQLSRERDMSLTALRVIEDAVPLPPNMGMVPAGSPMLADLIEQEALVELRANMTRLGGHATSMVTWGPVPEAIVAAASALPAELVVVGSVGRTGLARVVLGNTAETVLAQLPCSVWIVRS